MRRRIVPMLRYGRQCRRIFSFSSHFCEYKYARSTQQHTSYLRPSGPKLRKQLRKVTHILCRRLWEMHYCLVFDQCFDRIIRWFKMYFIPSEAFPLAEPEFTTHQPPNRSLATLEWMIRQEIKWLQARRGSNRTLSSFFSSSFSSFSFPLLFSFPPSHFSLKLIHQHHLKTHFVAYLCRYGRW